MINIKHLALKNQSGLLHDFLSWSWALWLLEILEKRSHMLLGALIGWEDQMQLFKGTDFICFFTLKGGGWALLVRSIQSHTWRERASEPLLCLKPFTSGNTFFFLTKSIIIPLNNCKRSEQLSKPTSICRFSNQLYDGTEDCTVTIQRVVPSWGNRMGNSTDASLPGCIILGL